MKKIVSFGDSFVFGNELTNNDDGNQAWPALVARDLDCEYQTLAVPGCGNENIARQIYTYFSTQSRNNTLAVINWTWTSRWDFFLLSSNCWITLGPTCVPGKLEHLIGHQKAKELIEFYQTHTGQSDIWNLFRSLQSIYAVQCWLKQHNILNIQTYMDRSMIENIPINRLEHYDAVREKSWPEIKTEQELSALPDYILKEVNDNFYSQCVPPDYIKCLQTQVISQLDSFEGHTFLEWSYANNFPVTELLHPLETAHQAAAQLWRNRYKQILEL